MKRPIVILLCLLFPCMINAEQYPSLIELDEGLVPLYEHLMEADDPSGLVGTDVALTLNLRHASEKRVLFNDTRIIIDEKTKYYFVMWKFDPEQVANIIGKLDIECKIEGRVVDVVKGSISPGMPHLIVEIDSVQVLSD